MLHSGFDVEVLLNQMLSTEGPRLVMGDLNNDQLEDFILLGAKDDADKIFLQNQCCFISGQRIPRLYVFITRKCATIRCNE